jgi:hypothetical protein
MTTFGSIYHLQASPPTTLTLGEAAKFAGEPRDVVHDAIFNRKLAVRDVEGRRFVRTADLRRWVEERDR